MSREFTDAHHLMQWLDANVGNGFVMPDGSIVPLPVMQQYIAWRLQRAVERLERDGCCGGHADAGGYCHEVRGYCPLWKIKRAVPKRINELETWLEEMERNESKPIGSDA